MLCQNATTLAQINAFYNEKVQARRIEVHKTVRLIAKIVQDLLKDVEHQEPRFISTLVENTQGRYDGVSIFLNIIFATVI